jgi:NAD-dependent dihydropyrimidine dehydrogenase PreA subunit
MTDTGKQAAALVQAAASLLSDGTVSVVIGLRENTEAGAPTPCFVRKSEDAGKLIWNPDCSANLAVYLLETEGKAAIAAKPCDVRSIINLLAENQIRREDVTIIGMECGGMRKDGVRAPGCDCCPSSVPGLYDLAVGADGSAEFAGEPMPMDGENITEWAISSTVDDRRDRFLNEIDKCILCFSCRQACQGCYCTTCFIDRKANPWDQVDADRATKIAFHLTRAMHLAGRCTDCGACEKVCASGVNLKYLYRGISEFLEESFAFRAGVDPEARPVMNSFDPDDQEIGFLGGDRIVGL